ncbi:hypothetical protein ACIBEJ_04905 [Nonomuraea sp. NPDC050790]|uniref:hypothetical protein n=1 Tax=Nonomuraea sp. NPDC050790 TaxID=3364371 RepID=UPI0037BB64C3
MMHTYDWSPPARVPGGASVIVREALLPMLMWESVPVRRQIDQDLTIVDRFVVEAALSLTPVRPEDVEEVTGIPRDAITRIAGRLTGLGVLRTEADGYHAVAEKARLALERHAIPEFRIAHLTLLYLPGGGDLIAFESGPGSTDAPLLHKAQPPASLMPAPDEVAGRPLADLLRARIASGGVTGLPDDVVDAEDGPEIVPRECPVYRCRGHVRGTGESATLVLDLLNESGKKATRCIVPGAGVQAGIWSALAARAAEAASMWGKGTVTAVQETATRWAYTLDGAAADAVASTGLGLSRPARLSIREVDCVVSVDVTFVPVDEPARNVFALVRAVRELADTEPTALRPEDLAAATSAARQTYELADEALTAGEVERRLWDDGHYRHMYALRETADFAYD